MNAGMTVSGISGMIDWEKREMYVEGKRVDVDEIGGFYIDMSEMLKPNEAVTAFKMELSTLFNEVQLNTLYKMWGTSPLITIRSTANALRTDKKSARQVLDLGEGYGILGRHHNNSWKVIDSIAKVGFAETTQQSTGSGQKQTVTEALAKTIGKLREQDQSQYEQNETIDDSKTINEQGSIVETQSVAEVASSVRVIPKPTREELIKNSPLLGMKGMVREQKTPAKKVVIPPTAVLPKKKPLIKKK